MRGPVYIKFALLALSAVALCSHAQVPPPGTAVAPSAGTNRPSFFTRPGVGGTNRPGANLAPAFPGARPAARGGGPAAPGAVLPAAPGAALPAAPGTVPPGTTVIPPTRPAGATTASGSNAPNPTVTGGIIGAGMIKFQETDLNQVLEFYADLTGRTILRSPQVPQNVKITLHNQTDLS